MLPINALSTSTQLEQYQNALDAYVVGTDIDAGLEDAFRVKALTKAVADAFDRFRSLFDGHARNWPRLKAAALKVDWSKLSVDDLERYHLTYWNDNPTAIPLLRSLLEAGTRLADHDESSQRKFYESLIKLREKVVGDSAREGASIRELVSQLNSGLRDYRGKGTTINVNALEKLRDALIYAYEHRENKAIRSLGLESRSEYERYKDQFNPEMQNTFANHVIDFVLGFFGFLGSLFSSFFIGLLHLIL